MDLIVDASLDDTNRDLKAIHQEFDDAAKGAKENTEIWGQADVTKAMDQFANNWYAHRDKLNERLAQLSDRVDKACAAWSDAEKQLSESLHVQDA